VGRFHAYAVSALVLVATAWPATRPPHDDSYPFSTYPMFAHRRGRVNDVTRALAIRADASETAIAPRYVANAETMQAFYTLARAVAAGPDAARALCETVAQRIHDSNDPELSSAERVELVTESVDAIDYLSGRAHPFDRHVHASCQVPR
jgi:hypothetical protein